VKSPEIKELLQEKTSPARNPPKEKSPLDSDPVKAGEQEEYLERWYEKCYRNGFRGTQPEPFGSQAEVAA